MLVRLDNPTSAANFHVDPYSLSLTVTVPWLLPALTVPLVAIA
jgi:hypothetical protein